MSTQGGEGVHEGDSGKGQNNLAESKDDKVNVAPIPDPERPQNAVLKAKVAEIRLVKNDSFRTMMLGTKPEVTKALGESSESNRKLFALNAVAALGLDVKFADEICADPKFQEIAQKVFSTDPNFLINHLKSSEKNKPIKEFCENRKALAQYFKTFAENHNVKFDQNAFGKVFYLAMKEHRSLIAEAKYSSSKSKEVTPAKRAEYLKAKEDLQEKLEEKLAKDPNFTEEQAQEEMDKLLAKYVENSGDEELKDMWKQKEEMDTWDAKDEYPVADEQSKDEAIKEGQQEMTGTGFDITSGSGGELEVRCSGDASFCVYVTVFQKSNDAYVYYVNDKFSNIGKTGPIDSKQLPEVADKRHIDGFLTQRLNPKLTKDTDNVSVIPDAKIIKMGEALITKGTDRGHKIDGDNKKYLEGLVKVLSLDDKKYPDFDNKVDRLAGLNGYFNKEENVSKFRNKLRKGDIGPLSYMIGE